MEAAISLQRTVACWEECGDRMSGSFFAGRVSLGFHEVFSLGRVHGNSSGDSATSTAARSSLQGDTRPSQVICKGCTLRPAPLPLANGRWDHVVYVARDRGYEFVGEEILFGSYFRDTSGSHCPLHRFCHANHRWYSSKLLGR